MLVLALDSLRRCECQPTPPMLWLRSDRRLVWHLLVGGCFLSLWGGGGQRGGCRGWERPHGAVLLPESGGGGQAPSFSGAVEKGCCPGRAGDGGSAAAPPGATELVPLVPMGRSSRRRSCRSCLGLSPPSPVAGNFAPWGAERRPTGKGTWGPGGTALLPAATFGVSSMGKGPHACGARSGGAPDPIALSDLSPTAPSTMLPAPGAAALHPACLPPAWGLQHSPPQYRPCWGPLCFPFLPSLQDTRPTAASCGSTRGAATPACSAPTPRPRARR